MGNLLYGILEDVERNITQIKKNYHKIGYIKKKKGGRECLGRN